ncbi:MAG: SDR family NAD(P)-dependent oxidoreductase [Dehalococcoidia bacterium]
MSHSSPANSGINSSLVRSGRLAWTVVLDIVIVLASYAVGLYLKFDGNVPNESWNQLALVGMAIAFAYVAAYQIFGIYRTAWQYGSIRDAILLAVAVGVVTAAILVVQVLLPKRPIPLTVNVIAAAFIYLFAALVRLTPRLWSLNTWTVANAVPRQRVLIVGAGGTGQMLASELQHNPTRPYRAVCFIDDDASLKGKRIHGIPVAGSRYDIPDAIEKHGVELVAIALPDRTPGLQEILALCQASKVPVRMVPRLSAVMAGRAQTGEMREVTMEDLLAREPVDFDLAASRDVIEDKVVLITGAAGSIGSHLSRMVLDFKPATLYLVDMNETALYELRVDLQNRLPGNSIVKFSLCNIADRGKLEDLFEAARPNVIFHLAAYKHITMVEDNPDQGFENNVIGTLNVFECAQAVRAEQVVFISSHIAVNPTSIYGASKRIGELLVQSMPPGRTKFCAVRSVNAIDAKGAVLGIFERQLDRGGPISVTDPESARYFLSIDELAGLLIQAAALSKGRDLFLVDVGEDVRIGELAERLIRARGMEPGKDVQIIYTGLRKGEKLREALTGEHESLLATAHPSVLSTISSLHFSGAELRAGIKELEVDRKRRAGNLAARLHALARIDQEPDGVVLRNQLPGVSEPAKAPETKSES